MKTLSSMEVSHPWEVRGRCCVGLVEIPWCGPNPPLLLGPVHSVVCFLTDLWLGCSVKSSSFNEVGSMQSGNDCTAANEPVSMG